MVVGRAGGAQDRHEVQRLPAAGRAADRGPAVDGDLALAFGHPDPRHGGLPPAGPQVKRLRFLLLGLVGQAHTALALKHAQRGASVVATDIITRVAGKRLATTVGRKIPVVGGVVGAGADGFATWKIGRYADRELLPRRR